ncbi:MAG: hypothetical protein E7060_05820 [Treponema bryantii]|nr:hypothetical protein [Treponema bryantii]
MSYEELLAVNGGCGGGTTSRNSQSQSPSSSPTVTPSYNYGSGGASSCVGTSSSGSCGGGSSFNGSSSSFGGSGSSLGTSNGSCGGGSASPSGLTGTPNVEMIKTQNAYNDNDYHCDIYAWNLAVENGLDPTNGSNEVIDLNQNTVADMYNKYFGNEDTSDGVCEKNTKGLAFYDGTNDGVSNPTHVEYYDSTNSSSNSFTKYSTDGIAEPKAEQRSYSDSRNENWMFVALN